MIMPLAQNASVSSPNPMWTVNAGSRAAASSAAGAVACLKFSEYPGRSFDDDGMGIPEMQRNI